MKLNKNIFEQTKNELIKLTKEFEEIEYTQGTGSNTSVKFGNILAIKASGYRLKDISQKSSIAYLKYLDLKEGYINKKISSQEQVNNIISKNSFSNINHKSSIETGFHSYLQKYTIHLHPQYLNLILCLKESNKILKEIYSDKNYLLIDYFKPGHDLSVEICNSYNNEEIIFLKNHGLIISTNYLEKTISLAHEICNDAKDYVLNKLNKKNIKIERYSSIKKISNSKFNGLSVSKLSFDFFFPDAVVFLDDIKKNENNSFEISNKISYSNLSKKLVNNIDEILFIHNFIATYANHFGSLSILSEKNAYELLNMDEEKYRKNLLS